MLMINSTHLDEGLGEADRHGGVVGVAKDVQMLHQGFQPGPLGGVEGQLSNGIAYGASDHGTEEPGFEAA